MKDLHKIRFWLEGKSGDICQHLNACICRYSSHDTGILIDSDDYNEVENAVALLQRKGTAIAIRLDANPGLLKKVDSISGIDAVIVSDEILKWDISDIEVIRNRLSGKEILFGVALQIEREDYSNVMTSIVNSINYFDVIQVKNGRRSNRFGYDFERVSYVGKMLTNLSENNILLFANVITDVNGVEIPNAECKVFVRECVSSGMRPVFKLSMASDERANALTKEIFDSYSKKTQVCPIGVVWNENTGKMFTEKDRYEGAELPLIGIRRILSRMSESYTPVHVSKIDVYNGNLLIVPSHTLTDGDSLLKFINRGGSVILFEDAAMYREDGELITDSKLYNSLGITVTDKRAGARLHEQFGGNVHSYHEIQKFHTLFSGFEECRVLAFGGEIMLVKSEGKLKQLTGYVPGFPISPCEMAYIKKRMPEQGTIFVGELNTGSRVVYFAGDQDRLYGRDEFNDYFTLLRNAIAWCVEGKSITSIKSKGTLDASFYKDEDAYYLYLTNLTGINGYGGCAEKTVPVKDTLITVDIPKAGDCCVESDSVCHINVSKDKVIISVDEILSGAYLKITNQAKENGSD